MIQTVILDGIPLNPGDVSWESIEKLASTTIYEKTNYEEVIQRSRMANILVVNKVILDEYIIDKLPHLKCICVAATGYNNVDIEAAKKRNIKVFNVVGYSSASVAQYVFAMMLEICNHGRHHANSVSHGAWHNRPWSYWDYPIQELAGKTFGIVGLGKIGQKVADIASAFDMKVLSFHKHPERDARKDVTFVSLSEVFELSDFVSLHCPLNKENEGFVNESLLSKMKPTAYLINTARGPLINEKDLSLALENNLIAGAILDVLVDEPPLHGNFLINAKNCLVTPHQAWASKASRQRLIEGVAKNIDAFLNGENGNVV